ncbi:MAG: hypothetical protein AAF471_03630 [Myxococcota bacterium]
MLCNVDQAQCLCNKPNARKDPPPRDGTEHTDLRSPHRKRQQQDPEEKDGENDSPTSVTTEPKEPKDTSCEGATLAPSEALRALPNHTAEAVIRWRAIQEEKTGALSPVVQAALTPNLSPQRLWLLATELAEQTEALHLVFMQQGHTDIQLAHHVAPVDQVNLLRREQQDLAASPPDLDVEGRLFGGCLGWDLAEGHGVLLDVSDPVRMTSIKPPSLTAFRNCLPGTWLDRGYHKAQDIRRMFPVPAAIALTLLTMPQGQRHPRQWFETITTIAARLPKGPGLDYANSLLLWIRCATMGSGHSSALAINAATVASTDNEAFDRWLEVHHQTFLGADRDLDDKQAAASDTHEAAPSDTREATNNNPASNTQGPTTQRGLSSLLGGFASKITTPTQGGQRSPQSTEAAAQQTMTQNGANTSNFGWGTQTQLGQPQASAQRQSSGPGLPETSTLPTQWGQQPPQPQPPGGPTLDALLALLQQATAQNTAWQQASLATRNTGAAAGAPTLSQGGTRLPESVEAKICAIAGLQWANRAVLPKIWHDIQALPKAMRPENMEAFIRSTLRNDSESTHLAVARRFRNRIFARDLTQHDFRLQVRDGKPQLGFSLLAFSPIPEGEQLRENDEVNALAYATTRSPADLRNARAKSRPLPTTVEELANLCTATAVLAKHLFTPNCQLYIQLRTLASTLIVDYPAQHDVRRQVAAITGRTLLAMERFFDDAPLEEPYRMGATASCFIDDISRSLRSGMQLDTTILPAMFVLEANATGPAPRALFQDRRSPPSPATAATTSPPPSTHRNASRGGRHHNPAEPEVHRVNTTWHPELKAALSTIREKRFTLSRLAKNAGLRRGVTELSGMGTDITPDMCLRFQVFGQCSDRFCTKEHPGQFTPQQATVEAWLAALNAGIEKFA